MRRLLNIRWTAVLGALFLVTLASGAAMGQTLFSLRSIGQPLPMGDSRMIGRGGWGMAVVDSMHPGFKNAASLAGLRHVALSFTGYGEQNYNKDETGERRTSRTMSPDVRVGIPIVKERFALMAGFQVYRATQYTTVEPQVWGDIWETGDEDDVISGYTQFRRDGSRFRVPLGAAWKPVRLMSLSAVLNLENGSVSEELTNFYDRPAFSLDPILVPVYLTDIKDTLDKYKGTSATFGVILDPLSGLQVGASWTPAYDLSVYRKVQHFGVGATYESEADLRMPDEYMAGFQLGLGKRWKIGGDARLMEYGKYEGEEEWVEDLEDEYGFSAGIERSRGQIRRGGMANLPIRIGYQKLFWGYSVNGEQIMEQSISLGSGFAFRGNLGQFDLSLSYGRIGDMEKNKMESEYWRFTMSIIGLERWW